MLNEELQQVLTELNLFGERVARQAQQFLQLRFDLQHAYPKQSTVQRKEEVLFFFISYGTGARR